METLAITLPITGIFWMLWVIYERLSEISKALEDKDE